MTYYTHETELRMQRYNAMNMACFCANISDTWAFFSGSTSACTENDDGRGSPESSPEMREEVANGVGEGGSGGTLPDPGEGEAR